MSAVEHIAAIFCAGVIGFRCVRVLFHMDLKKAASVREYLAGACFGLCYGLLCVAAFAAAIHILTTADPCFGDWFWLAASAGLILADRRRRKVNPKENDTTFNKQAGFPGDENHTGYLG